MGMQAEDRGFRDLLLQSADGRERLRRFREQIRPLVGELVRRGQDAGVLRGDVDGRDVLLVSLMVGAVADFASDIDPDLWQRSLGLLLDGLAARRDGATPLPVGPLSVEQADRAMAAWRGPRR